jgi:hypothetical protein
VLGVAVVGVEAHGLGEEAPPGGGSGGAAHAVDLVVVECARDEVWTVSWSTMVGGRTGQLEGIRWCVTWRHLYCAAGGRAW